jgi:ElaB/YqjD/DUF883 family membrane-anchored ribosome-binding protein
MSSESPKLHTDEIDQSFTNLLKPLEESAETTCQTIRKEADQLISRASEKIRSNPLPAVAGAFAFGIAIGCVIMSGRQSGSNDSFDLREPLAETGDILSSSLRALYENLKFW